MRIINVIILLNGIVVSVDSFPILKEETTKEVALQAENHFISVIEKEESIANNKFKLSDEEREDSLEMGVYDDLNGFEVVIVWSEVHGVPDRVVDKQ